MKTIIIGALLASCINANNITLSKEDVKIFLEQVQIIGTKHKELIKEPKLLIEFNKNGNETYYLTFKDNNITKNKKLIKELNLLNKAFESRIKNND